MQSSFMKTKGTKRKNNDEWGDSSDFQKGKKRKDDDYSKQRKQKRGEE